MLIPLGEIVQAHQMKIAGVLHVGAHEGEEAGAYLQCGVGEVWWVEGNPELLQTLRRRLRRYRAPHHTIEALVTDVDGGKVTFHVTNNMQSSSVLPFGTHRKVSPDVHFTHDLTLGTRTIDSLVAEHGVVANFVNLDIQGAELLALQGGEKFLEGVDYIYTEINVDELYVGCVRLPELDRWLSARGFIRCDTRMAGRAGWGDALYVRRGVRP